MGTMLKFFQSEGKILEKMDRLKIAKGKRSGNGGSREFEHAS